jgi:ectoine hydroxylase-related dioxygenase (phytanoyl-CoA dioxygenase family)
MKPVQLLVLFASLCMGNAIHSDNAKALPIPNDINDSSQWEEHRRFFKENGYLWIKNFFSREQVTLLKTWCDEINDASQNILSLINKNIPGTLIIVPEAKDPLQVCRAEDCLSFYPDLNHMISGTLTAYIGHLMGEPYVLFKDKINFKWPGGGAFLPHQDFPAYEFLGPREHITGMVCIDPATIDNGCLNVAKKWSETFADDGDFDPEQLQKGRVTLPYVIGTSAHGSIEPKYSDKLEWQALETSAGDLVIFNSFVPHYSETNNTNKPRRAMFLTHNRLMEGDHRRAYYHAKRNDPENPIFHIGTPTKARTK